MSSALGACDHDVHTAIGRVAEFVGWRSGIAAIGFDQLTLPFALNLEAFGGSDSSLFELICDHLGTRQ
jgi:hypothetical protein